MKKLFVIDGNSLINRAFYALPLLADSNGVYSNAVFGFINCLIRLILQHKPDYIAVAFDHARKTFRNDIFEMYKGTRKKTPDELGMQFQILKDILKSMNITCIEQEGIEADDIIGTIVKHSGCENIIITGDRDSLQLIDNNTKVWLTQKGISEIKEVNLNNIKELYGLTPAQVIDYKALAGDSSDNIPGVSGIGEKSAIGLINQFNNIDNIYANLDGVSTRIRNNLENGKEMCYMSYKLATIVTDCKIDYNVDEFNYDFPFGRETKEYFEKYSFKSLLKKDDIFSDEVKTNNDVEEIKSNASFLDIINKFNGNYICFDLQNNYSFAFNGCAYKLQMERSLFDLDPIDDAVVIEKLKNIAEDENVLKIVNDLKTHMHIFNTNKITNVFDINLADYVLSNGKGGNINSVSDYYNVYLAQKQEIEKNDMTNLYYNVELPLEYVLYDMEELGFKLDINSLNELKTKYGDEIKQIEKEIVSYSDNKSLNVRSAKQLSDFLFNELKISDKGNKKHSTGVEILNELVDQHPVITLILRYRKIQKLYSTYIEPYLSLIDKNGMIKTIFNQTLTATGRLSSSEPNLQNIPVRDEEGRYLRKIFISRFNGGKIMSADYNQIELRLLANFSKDEAMINAYKQGTDIHKSTASQIFNKPLNEVTDDERRMAKAVNFGIIYGISGYGLSKNISTSVFEANRYIDLYFNKYPTIKKYLDNLVLSAKQNGYVKTLYNRVRYIPEINATNQLTRTFGERVAMNSPLQGSASDIIKTAMINVHKRLANEGLSSKLILQIHDELIVDVYPGEENRVKDILIDEMQNVYVAEVPLLVSVGCGNNLYDCK